MKISLALLALMAWLPVTANAILMSLTPNGEDDGDSLEVGLSETGLVSVHLWLGAGDGNVSFVSAFFDATPIGDGDAVGYDVMGNIFKMERNDGTGWFRNVGDSSSRNIEDYALIAADDDQDFPREQWGTDALWEGIVDSIIIHGTEVGEYDLYFENQWTVEPGHAARTPGVFDRNNNQRSYSPTWCHFGGFPGFLCFTNAWRDDHVEFDVPFKVIVVPEPASFVLLTLAALPLLGRRRGE